MYLSKLIPFEISDHDQLTFVSVVVQCYPLIMIGIFQPYAEFFYIINYLRAGQHRIKRSGDRLFKRKIRYLLCNLHSVRDRKLKTRKKLNYNITITSTRHQNSKS